MSSDDQSADDATRRWDVFISHASEDNATVVAPLTEALERAGLTVWLDRNELRIGDSLRQKIDDGLARSRFGVVIISPSFLAKHWPQKELDGLTAIEDAQERRVILPVWHEIDKKTLARHAPLLAGTLAATTSGGIDVVAEGIVRAVTAPGSGAPSDGAPTPLRLLVDLLDREPDLSSIVPFLSAHAGLVEHAVGVRPGDGRWMTRFGSTTIDFCAFTKHYTTSEIHWHFVQFDSVSEHPLVGGELAPALSQRVLQLRAARRWIAECSEEAAALAPGVNPEFLGHVISGRRAGLTDGDREAIRSLSDELPGITIHTYDWLVDAAVERLRG